MKEEKERNKNHFSPLHICLLIGSWKSHLRTQKLLKESRSIMCACWIQGSKEKRNWNRLNWIIHFDNFCTQIGSFFGLMAFTLSSLCQPVPFSFHPLVSSFFSPRSVKMMLNYRRNVGPLRPFIYLWKLRKKKLFSLFQMQILWGIIIIITTFVFAFFSQYHFIFCCLAKYKICEENFTPIKASSNE